MQQISHEKVHEEAIVIDAVCPLLQHKKYIDWYIEGGATAVAPTVASGESSSEALSSIGGWLRFVKDDERLTLVKRAADIERAKRNGKTGIILHFQGTGPIEDNLDLVDAYKELGVGVIQLTYNVKNRVGDGASERTDCGLSYFGPSPSLRKARGLDATRLCSPSATGRRAVTGSPGKRWPPLDSIRPSNISPMWRSGFMKPRACCPM